jgi:hypothetical protein
MSRSVLGAFSAVLLALPAASAADWRLVYSGSDKTVEIDADSIKRRNDAAVLAWVRVSYSNDETEPGFPDEHYRSTAAHWAYKCVSGQGVVLELTEFSGAGGSGRVVVHEVSTDSASSWATSVPGTLLELELKFVCNHVPSAARATAQSETTQAAPPERAATGGGGIGADNQLDKPVDLNAPVQTKPTIGSEIKRGFDVSNQCIHFIGEGPLAFEGCITQLEHKSRESLADPRAFDVGIYLSAWNLLDIPGMNASDSTERMYELFRIAQGKLGVTDRQAVHAIGEGKDWEDKVLNGLREWAKQHQS